MTVINSTRLEYFMEVVQSKSLTQAAQSLFISQPALSKQIALFEQELGVQLFERSSKGVELTFAGRLLYGEAQELARRSEEIVHRLKIAGDVKNLTLRVGTSTPWAEMNLPPYVHQYRQTHINVTVQLQRYAPLAMQAKLRSGELDAAVFRTFSDATRGGLEEFAHKLLHRSERCVVVYPNHPLAKYERVPIGKLKDEPLAMISRKVNRESYNDLMSLCREAGFRPNIAAEYSLVESLYSPVLARSMITILSSDLRDYAPGELRFIPLEEFSQAELHAVWRKGERSRYVLDFVDCLPGPDA